MSAVREFPRRTNCLFACTCITHQTTDRRSVPYPTLSYRHTTGRGRDDASTVPYSNSRKATSTSTLTSGINGHTRSCHPAGLETWADSSLGGGGRRRGGGGFQERNRPVEMSCKLISASCCRATRLDSHPHRHAPHHAPCRTVGLAGHQGDHQPTHRQPVRLNSHAEQLGADLKRRHGHRQVRPRSTPHALMR